MKTLRSLHSKDKIKLADIENPEYIDEIDISEILESKEKFEIKIGEPGVRCEKCNSKHIRKRMVDLPVVDESLVFKKARVLFCAECKNTMIEEGYLEDLINKLNQSDIKVGHDNLLNILNKGIISHENNWAKLANERKVISIYFPSKDKTPQKAQISLSVSDPLYSKLSYLTSEDVRKILGLHFFEDLRKEAEMQNRTVSRYLKFELTKKILEKTSNIVTDRLTKPRALAIMEERAKYKYHKKKYSKK